MTLVSNEHCSEFGLHGVPVGHSLPRRGCKLECTMNGIAFLIAGGSLAVDGQSLEYENGVVLGVDLEGL